jgi:hypothetical protein
LNDKQCDTAENDLAMFGIIRCAKRSTVSATRLLRCQSV